MRLLAGVREDEKSAINHAVLEGNKICQSVYGMLVVQETLAFFSPLLATEWFGEDNWLLVWSFENCALDSCSAWNLIYCLLFIADIVMTKMQSSLPPQCAVSVVRSPTEDWFNIRPIHRFDFYAKKTIPENTSRFKSKIKLSERIRKISVVFIFLVNSMSPQSAKW